LGCGCIAAVDSTVVVVVVVVVAVVVAAVCLWSMNVQRCLGNAKATIDQARTKRNRRACEPNHR
jgi:hypothetical protein